MDTVYIETSIISYLRQRPSSQVVTAARQLQRVQYLLTWNCKHLANAKILPRIPIICTPEEFLGDDAEID